MALQAREKIAFLHVTELSIGFNGKLVKATKLELVCSLKREETASPLPFSSYKPRKLSMTLIPLHFTDYKVAPTEVAACSPASCITEKALQTSPDLPNLAQATLAQGRSGPISKVTVVVVCYCSLEQQESKNFLVVLFSLLPMHSGLF